jgi:cobalamin biosynthesis protein CobD/CbiB
MEEFVIVGAPIVVFGVVLMIVGLVLIHHVFLLLNTHDYEIKLKTLSPIPIQLPVALHSCVARKFLFSLPMDDWDFVANNDGQIDKLRVRPPIEHIVKRDSKCLIGTEIMRASLCSSKVGTQVLVVPMWVGEFGFFGAWAERWANGLWADKCLD